MGGIEFDGYINVLGVEKGVRVELGDSILLFQIATPNINNAKEIIEEYWIQRRLIFLLSDSICSTDFEGLKR